jgi:hypothetical protein
MGENGCHTVKYGYTLAQIQHYYSHSELSINLRKVLQPKNGAILKAEKIYVEVRC